MKHKLMKLSIEDLREIICEMLEESSHLGDVEHHKFKEIIYNKVYHFSTEQSEHIVKEMKPYGQVFPLEHCKNIIEEHLTEYDYLKYYLVMNMYANDSRTVADTLEVPLDRFCYMMAKTFINDIDAAPYKVEKYFTEVASV